MTLRTVQKSYSAEFEEKRSRFIANLVPIADFDDVLESLKAEHKKASHHVTAFRKMNANNRIVEGCKDDGEPAGTSGMPVLKILIGSDLVDVAVIVTRYFGGIKLGTGGLARAYSGAAKTVIEQAELVSWMRMKQSEIFSPYTDSAEIERRISALRVTVIARDFVEEGVKLTIEGPEDSVYRLTSVDMPSTTN